MRALRSAASVIASMALLIGVPWHLSTTIGNPLDRLPDLLEGDVNDHVVLAALATVLYVAWAQFAVAFAVELVSAVRRTPMPQTDPRGVRRPTGPGPGTGHRGTAAAPRHRVHGRARRARRRDVPHLTNPFGVVTHLGDKPDAP